MSTQKLPCGGSTYLDRNSTMSAHVCMDCLAVVGSMRMPEECKKLLDRQQDGEDAIRARHGDPY